MSDLPSVENIASRPRTPGSLTPMPGRKLEVLPSGDIAALARQHVKEHLVREVEAMLLFAMGSGIGVPPEIIATLERAVSDRTDDKAANQGQSAARAAAAEAERLGWRRTPSGADAPADTAPAAVVAPQPVEAAGQMSLFAGIHLQLTKLVAPAKPATLLLLSDQRNNHPRRRSFGAVPLVRKMLALAVLSLVVMLGVALSPDVNADNMTRGLLALQGLPLLMNEAFLIGAAAVGATLANLKRLDRYVSACTFAERYESSYWTHVVMGVISGVILSQVIYGAFIGTTEAAAGATRAGFTEIGQPVLAILGGFSAELVHDVLAKLISGVRGAFGASNPPAVGPAGAGTTAIAKSDRP
ncbi:MAG: hypothetical protein ACREFP_26650 [Acetobacteraceae bacterium]